MNKAQSFIIEGLAGKKSLKGTVRIRGAKNAALKAMAAAVLFDGPVKLQNVPKNADIETLSTILKNMGAKVSWKKDVLEIDTTGINSTDIDPEMAGSMRASVVLTGPMLARFGKVSFPAPGGCVIGARPIDLFLSGYEAMGAKSILDEKKCIYNISSGKVLNGNRISFKKISVGATETLMMAAVLAKGTTVLENCAMEPEIVNVAEWLNQCGAKISGVGTPTIKIEGTGGKLLVSKYTYTTIPDRIETGSYLILGALCAQELVIEDCEPGHLVSVIEMLKASGVPVDIGPGMIRIRGNDSPNSTFKAISELKTKEYPGFPTDLQPVMATYLTQVSGESRVVETIYEARFKYVDDLKKIGADISIVNEHEILIKGPTLLQSVSDSTELHAHDIRAGFALVMAALVGRGTFKIGNIHLIDRGYEKLEERLSLLGARIERRV